jgi:CheY-like chemotaxis protein
MLTRFDGRVSALVVDDDPVGLTILESLLESMSVVTRSAAGVAEAKSLLTQFTPDIAILDVLLSDGDGAEILLTMRQANFPTAVAFITASLEEFPFHKCESSPPDMLFAKPVDESALRAWVREMATLRGLTCGECAKAG